MSDFQHRHYAKVARILCDATPRERGASSALAHDHAERLHTQMVAGFADMFASDNPRFDRGRFMDAARGSPLGKDADSAGVARVAGRRYR